MSYHRAFTKLSIWNRGIVQARSGAKRHLVTSVNPFTLCGKNTVTMQHKYTTQFVLGIEDLEKRAEFLGLPQADQVMRCANCKDCKAEFAKRALLIEASET